MDHSQKDDSAATLVGRLIRSYRDDFRPNGRRLSQEGLLELMVARGEEYATNLDRSAVSHWERGARLAPREFLIAFGRACDIPKGEVDRMLSLAGYDVPDDEKGPDWILATAHSIESQVESLQREVRNLIVSTAKPEPAVDTLSVVNDALRRMAPPGVFVLVVGFILDAMGLNGTLVLLTYLMVAFAIVIGQGVLRWLKPDQNRTEHDHVVDLFFISLFFTLNASLLIGTLTKADHFGFYTIRPFTNTPLPFLFTTLANLALSLVASVMFSLLWKHQHGPDGRSGAFVRAVWTTLPPILFTYFSVSIFTNLGVWIAYMVIFLVLFGAFMAIVALNEPGMALRDADFVLKAAVMVIAVLCTFGVAGTLVFYVETDMLLTAADIRIIPLREISAEELGYTSDEGVKLVRLGALWMSLANIGYLVTVVGGYLLVTINRVASDDGMSTVPENSVGRS